MVKFHITLDTGKELSLTEAEVREFVDWCRGDQSKVDTIIESVTPKEAPDEKG